MEKRLAVAGIIVENRESVAELNGILHSFSDIIVGRMGMPYESRGVSVISLILDGTNDEIGALSGQLGKLKGVSVKCAVAKERNGEKGVSSK